MGCGQPGFPCKKMMHNLLLFFYFIKFLLFSANEGTTKSFFMIYYFGFILFFLKFFIKRTFLQSVLLCLNYNKKLVKLKNVYLIYVKNVIFQNSYQFISVFFENYLIFIKKLLILNFFNNINLGTVSELMVACI